MEPTRDRALDLVRAVAIWAVVLGHWMLIAVTETEGTLDGVNALGRLGWTHPLTWLFQVMPLFFLVGGVVNATSLARHRQLGGDLAGWVLRRYRRLLVPASAPLGVLVVAVALGRAAGVDADLLGTGAWVATVPLWFLAAYLAMVALTPASVAASRRWGLLVPAAGALVVGLGDVARMTLDDPWMAEGSYLVGWLVVHQLGVAWQGGRLQAGVRAGLAVAGAGGVALVGLTVLGPYPVSMVAVPGGDLQNTEPPTLALLALAVTQAGLLLAAHHRLGWWLRRPRRWAAVARVQSMVLTLFLWHMAAAVVAAVALHGTGVFPVEAIGSGRWWLLRLPWLAMCAVVLAALVAAFARLDDPDRLGPRGTRAGGGARRWMVTAGAVASVAGMLRIALAGSGSHGPLALPTDALVAFGLGVVLLAWATARAG
ncbi:MAG TPA: acyltransferase [Acidimicrobiales bacterium]|nr:acyltransferase [Acidimicrobiales bacterium]